LGGVYFVLFHPYLRTGYGCHGVTFHLILIDYDAVLCMDFRLQVVNRLL
jgi:hypothetical protein